MPFCPILRHVLALIALLSGCGHFSASTKNHWSKNQLTSVTKYQYFVTEISKPFDHAFLPYPSSRPRLNSAAIRLRALLG